MCLGYVWVCEPGMWATDFWKLKEERNNINLLIHPLNSLSFPGISLTKKIVNFFLLFLNYNGKENNSENYMVQIHILQYF